MELVHWEDRPVLRRPLFVIAFEGWNDAGDAATLALDYLATEWGATRCATIDPEEFYDFTVARPTVKRDEAGGLRIEWPGSSSGRLESPIAATTSCSCTVWNR